MNKDDAIILIDWGLVLNMGMVLTILLCLGIFSIVKVNISDSDLYRFCMVHKIELQDCKIPPHLEKTYGVKS